MYQHWTDNLRMFTGKLNIVFFDVADVVGESVGTSRFNVRDDLLLFDFVWTQLYGASSTALILNRAMVICEFGNSLVVCPGYWATANNSRWTRADCSQWLKMVDWLDDFVCIQGRNVESIPTIITQNANKDAYSEVQCNEKPAAFVVSQTHEVQISTVLLSGRNEC